MKLKEPSRNRVGINQQEKQFHRNKIRKNKVKPFSYLGPEKSLILLKSLKLKSLNTLSRLISWLKGSKLNLGRI